ncbi:MAG: stage II sporulation protein M, partial [Treponema sp.]|nr:stage II sporulation protein M [Treponema sp.]
ELEKIIAGGTSRLRERAAWFPPAFRRISGDLNTARSHGFDPSLIDRLNSLTMEGNQLLYGREPLSVTGGIDLLFRRFPRAVREHWRSFWACFSIFFGLALITALICVRFPDFVYELMSRRTTASLEEMYDPQAEHFLEPRDVEGDADMFGYYIYNNISIGFRSFGGGVIAGIGSLFILAFNGIFIGAAAAHIINSGYTETFFSFTSGHSAFELTALVLCAQGGLLLGFRFFFTRGLSRGASIREAGKAALPIIGGGTFMLVLAAVIEAFWSSRHEIPPPFHFAFGAVMAVLVTLWLFRAGRNP